MPIVCPFIRLTPTAVVPMRATTGAAGYDLYADETFELCPGERRCVRTGIAAAIPQSYQLEIRPRSGLARQFGVTVLNAPGTVDADYRGEIMVLLVNFGAETVHIHQGDRIAQAVFTRFFEADWIEADSLDETSRGCRGFGSTGKS